MRHDAYYQRCEGINRTGAALRAFALFGAAFIGATNLVASAAPAPTASPFISSACVALGFKAGELGDGVECGWLTVPESRNGKRRNLRLAVVVAHATDRAPAGDPILYVHGGPGIATLDVVPRALKGKSWPLFREHHDLVFFDYRGTGRSGPALCAAFDQALAALQAEGARGQTRLARELAAAVDCRRELDALRIDGDAYTSTSIAADAEALRRALGFTRWNLFATSFGSLPAVELVRRWPARVRALILDSAFTPNSSNGAEQISATAESFAAFQRRCNADEACRTHTPDLRQSAQTVAVRLDREPLKTKTGEINGESFRSALWTLMVDGKTARYLPELLRRAEAGDDDLIRRFVGVYGDSGYFGGYSFAQAWLVNCHDIFPRPSQPFISRAAAAHPDLATGLIDGEQDQMCDLLQPQHASISFTKRPAAVVPTLVFSGEFDPATPRSDALAAIDFFPRSTLIEVDGASHAPFYTDACTKSIAVAFYETPNRQVDQSCLATRAPFEVANAEAFDKFLADLPR